MGFIAEFRLDSPLMRETFVNVPGMVLEMEDVHLLESGLANYIFWASGGSFDSFEEALAADSTVAEFTVLTIVNERRLYRITFTEEASQRLAYPTASKFDVIYLSHTKTNDGSTIRAQVPSRNALQAYREACEDRGVSFSLERVYEEQSENGRQQYGLTESQYESLVLAYERGYFGTTRTTDLEELAEEVDISRQAFSGRLRRGLEQLIATTLVAPT